MRKDRKKTITIEQMQRTKALNAFARLNHYPTLSDDVQESLLEHADDATVHCPGWCLLPLERWQQISEKYNAKLTPSEQRTHWHELLLLGPWRYTKGFYGFEQTVQAELLKTPMDDSVPSCVLAELPEWSQYILTPGYKINKKPIDGFWVSQHWSCTDRHGVIYIGVLFEDETIKVMPFYFNNGIPLSSIADHTWEVDRAQAELSGESYIKKTSYKRSVRGFLPLINLVAYLCSVQPDHPEEDGVRLKFNKTERRSETRIVNLPIPRHDTSFFKEKSLGDTLRSLTWSVSMGQVRKKAASWVGDWSKKDGDRYTLYWVPPRAEAIKSKVMSA